MIQSIIDYIISHQNSPPPKSKMTDIREHLKIARYLYSALGIWPYDLTGWKSKAYKAYFYISFTYWNSFVLCLVIKSLLTITEREILKICADAAIIVASYIAAAKVVICIQAPIRNCIREACEREKELRQLRNEEINAIYEEYVAKSNFQTLSLLLLAYGTIIEYFIVPATKSVLSHLRNEEQILIFYGWIPFDEEKYFYVAFVYQFIGEMQNI